MAHSPPCAECTDPGSGQKLHDVTDVPVDCAVTEAQTLEPGDAIAVTFAPAGSGPGCWPGRNGG